MAGAPETGKKSCWRRSCGCCLGILAVPAVLILAVVIWLSLGPAPAPADCLPPGDPIAAVFRDPAGLVDRVLVEDRWQPLRAAIKDHGNLPDERQAGLLKFVLRRAAGGEIALSGEGSSTVAAMRPGVLFRAFERVTRLWIPADSGGVRRIPDGGPCYAFIGKTLVVSSEHARLAEVLARQEQIVLKSKAASPSGQDAGVELRFHALLNPEAKDHRTAAYIFDLPCPSSTRGWLRADRELRLLAGELIAQEAIEAPSLPPSPPPAPLPSSGPASARLVPSDALGYWAWHAPAGPGRWQCIGRAQAMVATVGGPGSDLDELMRQFRSAGIDPEKVLMPRLAGERAVAVVSQPGPGGKPLLPALSFMAECSSQKDDWPLIRKALETFFGLPIAEAPPLVAGKAPDKYLLRHNHKGTEVVEIVYSRHSLGSGFRPAVAMVGRFAVFSTSRDEIVRMLDRAAGTAGGPALASAPDLAWQAGKPVPAAVMLLRPQGRGREMVDLALALGHALSEPGQGPGVEDEKNGATLAAVLSLTETIRVQWFPTEAGGVRLDLDGTLLK